VKLTSRSGNNHLARSRLFVGLGTKLFTIQARRKNHSSTWNRIPSIGKAEVRQTAARKVHEDSLTTSQRQLQTHSPQLRPPRAVIPLQHFCET